MIGRNLGAGSAHDKVVSEISSFKSGLETKRLQNELAAAPMDNLMRAVRRGLHAGELERLSQSFGGHVAWGGDPDRIAEPIIDEGGGAPADILID